MARKTTTAKPPTRVADFDDGILDSDSEVDEFTNYKAGIPRPDEDSEDESGEDDEDEDEQEGGAVYEDSEEEAGVGMYEPDAWDGGESSDEDEESDDEAVAMVRFCLCLLPAAYRIRTLTLCRRSSRRASATFRSKPSARPAA
jgi:hypothetical protein